MLCLRVVIVDDSQAGESETERERGIATLSEYETGLGNFPPTHTHFNQVYAAYIAIDL